MKLIKRFIEVGVSSHQRWEAAVLLTNIADLTNPKESVYYEKELLPYVNKHGYDKYIECLKEVKKRLEAGFRERNEPRAIVASVINKVLT